MSGGPGFLPSTASSCSFFGKIIILAMIFYLHSQPSSSGNVFWLSWCTYIRLSFPLKLHHREAGWISTFLEKTPQASCAIKIWNLNRHKRNQASITLRVFHDAIAGSFQMNTETLGPRRILYFLTRQFVPVSKIWPTPPPIPSKKIGTGLF